MMSRSTILEKVRALVAPLNAEERLTVIQTIAAMPAEAEVKPLPTAERRNQLAAEQAAWYTLPLGERQRYQNEFIAMHQGQVIDHDADQRTLYLRVRAKLGHTPVLIVSADWEEPPIYTIHSPHLE